MLPKRDGLEILREVRRLRPTLPVIILTARGEEADRVRGLSDGADDYVVKPFSVKELLARVEAVLRRSAERPGDVSRIAIPGGTIDLARREVRFARGDRTELSEREAELIGYLAANSGRAIAREELLANVWRISPRGVTTRTIDMHVTRLREKLRDATAEPKILLTVRGKGYMFQSTKLEARHDEGMTKSHVPSAFPLGRLRGMSADPVDGDGLGKPGRRAVGAGGGGGPAARIAGRAGAAGVVAHGFLARTAAGSGEARSFAAYQAFLPADFARSSAKGSPHGRLWMPSPLLASPTPQVLLYFEIGPEGRSPRRRSRQSVFESFSGWAASTFSE